MFLSLTYCPVYLNEIDYTQIPGAKFVTHNFRQLQPGFSEKDVPRVWPAFGKIGGFRELLITGVANIPARSVHLTQQLNHFCIDDPYYQDNTQSYHVSFLRHLINAIRNNLDGFDYRIEDYENLNVKIDTSTVSTVLSNKIDDRKISLSAAYMTGDLCTILWLWGTMYRDNVNVTFETRSILNPIAERVSLLLSESELDNDDGTLGGNINIINDKIRTILRALSKIGCREFELRSNEIPLP